MARKHKGSAGEHSSSASSSASPPASSSPSSPAASAPVSSAVSERRKELRAYRKSLSIYTRPFPTLYYFVCEIFALIFRLLTWLVVHSVRVILCVLAVVATFAAGYYASLTYDPEFTIAQRVGKEAYHALFWVVLGFLSSFGMGTGLHTFIMYLGPMIAAFTVTAYHCKSTALVGFDFSDPDTWNKATCPSGESTHEMTVMQVIDAIRFSSMLWGLGTAIGELPPYFMAKAARESQEAPDDEDLQEFHESLKDDSKQLSSNLKRQIHNLVQKAGFIGILLCASIPNPLFDLAGLACGHFGIPFMTFASATAIGKGIIKVHIQMFFVVILTSKPVFNHLLNVMGSLPAIGSFLVAELKKARENMTESFAHHDQPESTSIIGFLFRSFVFLMLLFFALSIVEHLAQRNRHRKDNAELEQLAKSS